MVDEVGGGMTVMLLLSEVLRAANLPRVDETPSNFLAGLLSIIR